MPPPRYKNKKSRSFKIGIFFVQICLPFNLLHKTCSPATKSFGLRMQRTYTGFNRTLSSSCSTQPLRRASSKPRESETVTLSPNRV